eukprot:CAMPEP_0198199796 /NCGR_PEP_ID=MMETSP1445-20131203/2956_1 /TAXON_ID=36898 /ORGANISM="Pyramimonas sp., Strain CCMP2087" /LENGTH=332 /DNA_ID=CAMNT_0043869695 /DNA_START=336 /DNA_END=1334 /DNA_ORIENTATION=+
MKNVCQVCLLDLEFGLPVQVRDQCVGASGLEIAKSDVNREYQAEAMDKAAAEGIDFDSQYGKVKKSDMLLKLQRTAPYYKRNRAHICSFFAKGECTRGAECPYRHEMPETGPLAEQNLKDRFYGVNDPVAEKMLSRANNMPVLSPPEDSSIMTLYVGGMDSRIQDDDLKDAFYSFGEIASLKIIRDRNCAFVTYTSRSSAERAADALVNKLVIKGVRCKLMWGKPARQQAVQDVPTSSAAAAAPPPSMYPPQVQAQMAMRGGVPGGPPPLNYFNLPPQSGYGMPPPMMAPPGGMHPSYAPPPRPYYPSMDPSRMGSTQQQEGAAQQRDGAGQ